MKFQPVLVCLLVAILLSKWGHAANQRTMRTELKRVAALTDGDVYRVQQPEARLFDTFGVVDLTKSITRRPSPSQTRSPQPAITEDDIKARVDNYAIELYNDPTSTGVIKYVRGRRQRFTAQQRRSFQAALEMLKDYLVNVRGLDAGRVLNSEGEGGKDTVVEVWIVPAGAAPPGDE